MSTFISRQTARLGRAAAPVLTPVLVSRPLNERLRSHAIFRAVRPSVQRSENVALERIDKIDGTIKIERDLGVGRIALDPALVAACVEDTKRRFQLMKAGQSGQRNTKKYLQSLTALRDYGSESAPFRLATSDDLVKAVSQYLGGAPVLWNIAAMYSPPTASEVGKLKGSQYWHRDSEDIASIKVWILCSDVSEENGPTHCLPRKLSDDIAVKIGYRQGEKIVDDAVMDPYNSQAVRLVGSIGDTFVTDTCRCFHMGSRTGSSSERLVLMFNFITRHSVYFWPGFRSLTSRGLNESMSGLSEMQRDLLFPFYSSAPESIPT